MDTQNILFLPEKDASPEPPGPRWADTLSRLVQSKVSQSFENAGLGQSVGHNDALTGDYQLLIDIRNFQMIAKPEPTAEVELYAKISDVDGKIAAAQPFKATAKAKSAETTDAVAALREAFSTVAGELVVWTASSLKPEADPAPEPPAEAPPVDEPAADAPPADAPPADAGALEAPGGAQSQ
jgi:phospholipid/cholesterol/gamma-HCH transport system substrate-binding protein